MRALGVVYQVYPWLSTSSNLGLLRVVLSGIFAACFTLNLLVLLYPVIPTIFYFGTHWYCCTINYAYNTHVTPKNF